MLSSNDCLKQSKKKRRKEKWILPKSPIRLKNYDALIAFALFVANAGNGYVMKLGKKLAKYQIANALKGAVRSRLMMAD